MSIKKLTKEFIMARMQELGIKQTSIISETGSSKGAVSKWVNGVSEPKGQELFKFLKALKLSFIDGEIVKNDYIGIEVPVITTSEIKTKCLKETTKVYTTKEKNVEFIISVNTHDFLFPFGTKLYIKKFNSVESFKNNILIVLEDDNKYLKIGKLTFFNDNYYISQGDKLETIDIKSVKFRVGLAKFI
ncbi:helix-turn-helix domain-containing protein [Francisella sp. SYW-9]|uniref:helix-turn-helix domain-containing protein n=1 Tax=Francisella sp. SYW-9 TaxID=2610888 RepID=UPI00123D8D8E|nr:helix-turn-helix domain-containing protein [Francisella sp. SYW-9]